MSRRELPNWIFDIDEEDIVDLKSSILEELEIIPEFILTYILIFYYNNLQFYF
jgi:hypothetical protein